MQLLRDAGCAIPYMAPFPSAEAVCRLTAETRADAILTRQGPVNGLTMAASDRLRVVAAMASGSTMSISWPPLARGS